MKTPPPVPLIAFAALVLAPLASLATGTSELTFDVLLESRLPRTAAAALVGGALALAATLLQTITRNPLAEPGLLGVNAGAVLGLAVGLCYFSAGSTLSFMAWAGGGALGACAAILAIAQATSRPSPARLVLIGIALSATLGGIANAILMSNAVALEQFRVWNLGSLSGVRSDALATVAPVVLTATCAIALVAGPLSLMQFGEEKARTLGVRTDLIAFVVWILTATLTACAIAVAGPILFAGFLAAYLARAVAGARFARQLVLSAAIGSALLLVGDSFARWVIRPFEVPVGVIIAFLGTPLTLAVSRSAAFRAEMVRDGG